MSDELDIKWFDGEGIVGCEVGASKIPHMRMSGNIVRAYHYPFCCTGVVLAGLGGSESQYECDEHPVDFKLETSEVFDCISKWIKYYKENTSKQFISACTTSEQEDANEALTELGFIQGAWMENTKYADTQLCTWTLHITKGE